MGALARPARGSVLMPRTARRRASATAAPWGGAVLGALVLALLSLLGPSEPTYDPWAWIIWSREVTEGALATTSGPSWKPLPVMVTAPFALLGGDVAPAAWLVVARAGGLLAVVGAYRLGTRLAGRGAGAVAGATLLLADEFVHNFARGNSEGLLVALVLFAVERHRDGRPRSAFGLAYAAALLRPEVWPFLGLYGLWLALREPRWRGWLVLSGVALIALWFGPEWWGSGNPLRASDRARQPNPDSAAFAAHPFLEVFRRASHVLMAPVVVGAALAVAGALRRLARGRGGGEPLAYTAGAAILMVMVAAMTQAGYAGNLRYVALPAALLCALAGAGWVELLRGADARYGRPAAALLLALAVGASLPFAAQAAGSLRDDLRLTRAEATLYGELDRAIAADGGAARALACGPVFTGRFDTLPLAWRLHAPIARIGIFPYADGTLFAARRFSLTRTGPSALSRDPRFAVVAGTPRWVVRARCGR